MSVFEHLMTIFTGERMHTILKICSNILGSLFYKPRFVLLFTAYLTILLGVLLIFTNNKQISERFSSLITESPVSFIYSDSSTSTYWGAWRSGIQLGLNNPIFGSGVQSNRHLCSTLDERDTPFLPGKNFCGNHPHNYYIQLFSETGLVGLLLGTLMFLSIIKSCYDMRKLNTECPMAMTCFIIPLAIFFPFQQFGNFFGQWGNLFVWFAIGFATCQIQVSKKLS